MPTERKLISVIVPAYNEEDCVQELADRLSAVFEQNASYDFEAIIVENGSTDRTWELLQQIHDADRRFKIVQLSRNFRMDGGITAGLEYARGDAVVIMTADLQDPPELISEFIQQELSVPIVVVRQLYTNQLQLVQRNLQLVDVVNNPLIFWTVTCD